MKRKFVSGWLLCLILLAGCLGAIDPHGQAVTTIRADVSMVIVPVMVVGKGGKGVPALEVSDFRVFENDKEQAIVELMPKEDPFHVALMIDRSGSTQYQANEMKAAAIAFIEALRPQDRIMIVSFDREVRFDSEFISDRDLLRPALDLPYSEGGQTGLYDALARVHERMNSVSGRKAIILFSDGVDNISRRADASGVLRMIEHSDVLVYAVQYDTRKNRPPVRFQVPPPPGYPSFRELYNEAVQYLRKLTGQSGGLALRGGSISSLKDAFAQIAQELQRQYTLSYYSSDPRHDGSFRRIRVQVDRPGVTVRARPGYRASLPGEAPHR